MAQKHALMLPQKGLLANSRQWLKSHIPFVSGTQDMNLFTSFSLVYASANSKRGRFPDPLTVQMLILMQERKQTKPSYLAMRDVI